MSAKPVSTAQQSLPSPPRPEVRDAVRRLLTQTESFARLSPEKQRQVARCTALIADYLAAPEGFAGNTLPGGLAMPPATALDDPPPPQREASYDVASKNVSEIGEGEFSASAAREGAKVAGLLLKQVKFPTFVASLIEGVFHAIVKSSIEQMEAYTKMIDSVAKSLQQFTDDNVTENQGRDHMVEKFPDLFEVAVDDMSDTPSPKLRLRDGVDEDAALKRVNQQLNFEGSPFKSMDLSDENAEKALVLAARMQLARQRQQLMASLVMMGINRIVVTDGKLSAKIMYDFTARDSRSVRKSAAAYDFARNADGTIQTTRAQEGTYDLGGDESRSRQHGKDSSSDDYSADYYAKGTYKAEDKPVMTAMSTASEASDSQLQTRVQLAGAVEVNFKSDYLPLDKMATPGMIAAIQGNSTPVDPNVVPSPVNREPATSGAITPGAAAPAARAPAPASP
ncbi:hypothetical protein [Burkholderia sp. Ac-20365]|uniref:hypothetical protein n=1 Tax=Burkholderia sp. Ac-20365 TaxID=2703897 RepID=UPI00197B8DBB|nr:hypothetical protein [Burkholderia sp. Ac-20365]MBN3760741.1 hypothetical protein [Burkholderia sp. Ac-20365]